MNHPLEQVTDASKRTLFDWKEIWQYRELFYFFTWRDIKIKYKQTFLGFLWAVLQPLLMMIIFTLFFGRVINLPDLGIPYPVFVFSGLLIWTLFAAGLTNAATSMVNNATIIRKIYFPRLIIPVSSIMVALFDFFMAFILFIPLLVYYGESLNVHVVWSWPAAIVSAILATAGPGLFLAALNVKYRDFRYVIPFLVQILFFVTPVLFPVSMLPYPSLKYVVAASPVYAPIALFRFPLLENNLQPDLIGISLLSGLLFLAWGLTYFKRTEDFFADFA